MHYYILYCYKPAAYDIMTMTRSHDGHIVSSVARRVKHDLVSNSRKILSQSHRPPERWVCVDNSRGREIWVGIDVSLWGSGSQESAVSSPGNESIWVWHICWLVKSGLGLTFHIRTSLLSENLWHFFDVRIVKIRLCIVCACMMIKR